MRRALAFSILLHSGFLFWVIQKETGRLNGQFKNPRSDVTWTISPGKKSAAAKSVSTKSRPVKPGSRKAKQVKAGKAALKSGNRESGAETAVPHPLAQAIHEQIQAHLNYPLSLRRRSIQGRVLVKLVIAENGNLESLDLISSSDSSSHPELNRLALEAVRNAAPFSLPLLPSSHSHKKTGRLKINLPILFKLES